MILKPPALTYGQFATGLAVKIIMGCVYGFLFLHYYHGDDTWRIHGYALEETKVLLTNPEEFFINAYTPVSAIADGKTWFHTLSIYVHDLEYALVVKTLAIFNLLSQGNYYINVVLFNLVVFWGHYWLFIFLKEIFPGTQKILFIAVFLFIPVVFWLSGIRSDGLLFFFFSLFLLSLYRKKKLHAFIGLSGAFVIRPEFGLLLALSATAYLISRATRPVNFAVTYLVAVIIFFSTGLSRIVAGKQQQFSQLKGTRFEMNNLEPTFASYVKALPRALDHAFLRPYLWETRNPLQLMYAMEVLFFWLVVAFTSITRSKQLRKYLSRPEVVMLLLFCLSVYVFVGYIVPFPGAIVRYKIIPELVILCIFGSILYK